MNTDQLRVSSVIPNQCITCYENASEQERKTLRDWVRESYADFVFGHEQDRLLFLTAWPAHVSDFPYLLSKDIKHEL